MLKLDNITKDYIVSKELTVPALKGVSIDFRDSEFVSILGPSGCGKTTLLNIIGGLDQYTSGDLSIDNISTSSYKQSQWNSYRNNRVGFVFQSYNLIPHQTVVSNVELALTISGVGKRKRRARAIEVLTEVGLENELYKKPNQLSGGQMQRVAIARALINNPQIVLADEPTGALDSATSTQIMELLHKVSKNHLVIMVTHNAELADQYSTRLVKLKDGNIMSDSNPYNAPDVPEELVEPYAVPKVKMSLKTALSLSFKNLLTKKSRTMMTSFAGSIGIIGVALVLALNNGFNAYLSDMQSETLGSYPVQISTTTSDLTVLQDNVLSTVTSTLSSIITQFPDFDDEIVVYDPTSIYSGTYYYNYMDENFLSYMDGIYQVEADSGQEWLTDTINTYSYGLKTFTEYNGQYSLITSSRLQQGFNNSDFVLSQYEVLTGDYPQQSNEIAIIVDEYNRISTSYLEGMGIPYTYTITDGEVEYATIDINDVLGKSYYVMQHDNYWFESGDNYKNVSAAYSNATLRSDYFESIIDSSDTIELTITCVLRVNSNTTTTLFNTGLMYLPSLMEEYVEANSNSVVAQAQADAYTNDQVYVASGNYLYLRDMDYSLNGIADDKDDNGLIGTYPNITIEGAYQYYYQTSGVSTVPYTISYYATDFDSKDYIINYIEEWNAENSDQLIVYSDLATIVASLMSNVIDIISYVLIAIAGISLVVSSVMIGIITYVSVIERTKEIGVLRSIGASKRDVSSIFSAETFIIGLTSGVLGIVLAYLLCIPINLLLVAIGQGVITSNMAVLSLSSSAVLITISCILTVLGGAIPSSYASKIEPVTALRSE